MVYVMWGVAWADCDVEGGEFVPVRSEECVHRSVGWVAEYCAGRGRRTKRKVCEGGEGP